MRKKYWQEHKPITSATTQSLRNVLTVRHTHTHKHTQMCVCKSHHGRGEFEQQNVFKVRAVYQIQSKHTKTTRFDTGQQSLNRHTHTHTHTHTHRHTQAHTDDIGARTA